MDDYLPASSISQDGFARHGEAIRAAHGSEIRVWGFVDHANVDEGVVPPPADARLPGAAAAPTWSFNLKANENDAPGRSFRVVVPEDAATADLKQALVEAGRSGRPLRAFVTGTVGTFEAPANFRRYTGLLPRRPKLAGCPPGSARLRGGARATSL